MNLNSTVGSVGDSILKNLCSSFDVDNVDPVSFNEVMIKPALIVLSLTLLDVIWSALALWPPHNELTRNNGFFSAIFHLVYLNIEFCEKTLILAGEDNFFWIMTLEVTM